MQDIVIDQYKTVPIYGGGYTIIDEEDYERVSAYSWFLSEGYAMTKINGKNVKIHRFIMGVTDPKILVDHKLHNRLDNRKSQLRVCTKAQNTMNSKSKGGSSIYKGVSWFKRDKNWRAVIMLSGKYNHIGYFTEEIEAAKAYDVKAKELFGEFAYLNFK